MASGFRGIIQQSRILRFISVNLSVTMFPFEQCAKLVISEGTGRVHVNFSSYSSY